VRLFAISGSLRANSSNTSLLLRLKEFADVDLYDGLAALPHFNPDVEEVAPPPEALDLRDRVGRADAVVISSPEYAHGVPGCLKNALDWLVGGPEMVDKVVALINASPRSTHAQAQLKETISTMSARVVADVAVDAKRATAEEIDRVLRQLVDEVDRRLQPAARRGLEPAASFPPPLGAG
jgi:chromate reductase